jgi:IclR family KDG regulon transcriptional repressor
MKKQPPVKAIEKALSILDCFSQADFELDLSQIAQMTGLPKTTVFRILTTLEKGRLVSQNQESKKYKLGLRLFELGSVVLRKMELREVALPLMEKLSEESGETIHLGVLEQNEVMSIEKADSSFSLRSNILIGKRAPAYCTAVGKALLAFQPEQRIELFLQTARKKFTANTIIEVDKLREELEKVRQQGFAVDNVEHEEGVRCVGAPIRNRENKVAASISISGPSVRVTREAIPKLALMVKKTAEDISRRLGAPGLKRH